VIPSCRCYALRCDFPGCVDTSRSGRLSVRGPGNSAIAPRLPGLTLLVDTWSARTSLAGEGIGMKTLFCPKCGESYSGVTCMPVGRRWGFVDQLCPECQCRLEASGLFILVVWIPVAFFLSLFLNVLAESLAIIVFVTSSILASMRFVRQWHTRRRGRCQHEPGVTVTPAASARPPVGWQWRSLE
jgi:hypothetical protein